MRNKNLIYILLSSYNGEKYIEEQINSLIKQTYKNWNLLIRDDGSSDNSINIIKKFEKKYKRISLIKSSGNLGACKSFLQLVEYTKKQFNPEYIMFCDQDDVWLKNKIQDSIDYMKEKEESQPDTPILISTNLTLVDKNLQSLERTYFELLDVNPNKTSLRLLIHRCTIAGCSCILNKSLIKRIYDIPNKAIMHDYWIALIAASFGNIYRINESSILYRQHDSNYTGVNIKTSKKIYIILNFNLTRAQAHQNKLYKQASSFLRIYNKELNEKNKKLFEQYISISKSNIFKRAWIIISNKFIEKRLLRLLRFIFFG